jgi:hypothetical protein
MRHTAKTIYPLIKRYLEGNQSQKSFCESHNLSLAVLNYWISKYRQSAASAFIEVKPPVITQAFAEISFASGNQIRLLAPVSAAYLLDLVQ